VYQDTGWRVFFTVDAMDGTWEIWSVAVEGGEPERWEAPWPDAYNVEWDATGTHALYALLDSEVLAYHDINGGQLLELTTVEQVQAFEGRWFPDRQHVIFNGIDPQTGRMGMWMAAPDGSGLTPLSPSAHLTYDASVSPEGDWIAFIGQFGEEDPPGLLVSNPFGGEPSLLDTDPCVPQNPDWSPDGTVIAFTCWIDDTADVRVYHVASGDVFDFIEGPRAMAPSWSPDQNWIAYVAEVDGLFQLFVYDITESTTRQLTDFPEGILVFRPTWRPRVLI
jgi:Tol biopolymer transport system component